MTFEPATDSTTCQQIGATVADGELVISRQESRLTATFGGQAYDGTVFDTWSFALDSQGLADGGGLDARSFRGSYTATLDEDGGTSGEALAGNFDATLQRPGGGGTITCLLVRRYSAVRK